jgi:hypothetical protein
MARQRRDQTQGSSWNAIRNSQEILINLRRVRPSIETAPDLIEESLVSICGFAKSLIIKDSYQMSILSTNVASPVQPRDRSWRALRPLKADRGRSNQRRINTLTHTSAQSFQAERRT